MMKLVRLAIIAIYIAGTLGCKTVSSENMATAVITNHTDESITELRSVVKKALHGTPVMIANTAFNKSNRLVLERKKIKSPDGRVIDTRTNEEPIIFELYLKENTCYLKYLKTGEQFQLKQANCTMQLNEYQ